MLYILWGPDDYSLSRALEEIKKEIGDPAALADTTTTLDGAQVTLDKLNNVCQAAPFLMGRRLVIIKGLLERFQPRRRPARRGKTARADDRQNECKPIADCILRVPESTVLVLVDGMVTGTNPLFKELSAKAVVRSFPLIRGDELSRWISRHVAEEGGAISPGAITLLTRLVGSNLWTMASEIAKLVSFTAGRTIEEEDVNAVVSNTQQSSVFTMVDAIIDLQAGRAEQLLEELLQRGEAPAYLLTMLTRQIRLILRAGEMNRRRLPMAEIQHRLGLNSDYALRKTVEQSRRYSLPRLKEVYSHLLAADLAIKTGKYQGDLALNILVAELCRPGTARSHTGTPNRAPVRF